MKANCLECRYMHKIEGMDDRIFCGEDNVMVEERFYMGDCTVFTPLTPEPLTAEEARRLAGADDDFERVIGAIKVAALSGARRLKFYGEITEHTRGRLLDHGYSVITSSIPGEKRSIISW